MKASTGVHEERAGRLRQFSDDLGDRALFGFVTRVSGRTVIILSLLLYPGLGLALPLALGWPTPWLISANLTGVAFAAVISLGWLIVQLEAKDRRHLVEWTTSLRLLDAEEFEWMVGELFRRDGWDVRETGRQEGPDGNIDLELTRGAERRLVQCKAWQRWQVGVNDIRAFAGTLVRDQMPVAQGTFVTLSDFTKQAREEARRTGLTILDHRDLYAWVERVRRGEPCPNCDSPMRLGRSPRGWWFRCVTNGCSGKRDLSGEPGRVLELLTHPPGPASSPKPGS